MEKTTTQVEEWNTLAVKLVQCGLDICRTTTLHLTDKGYGEEAFLAMTLLARTLSNFKSAMLLLEHRRVVEGRVLARCCLENLYWVAGIEAEGEKFTKEMLNDEMGHRQRRGERLLKAKLALGDEVEANLKTWLRENGKRFKNASQLKPMSVAFKTDIGRSYAFYEQLSADAAHPSLEALNRHVIPRTADDVGGIDVEPIATDQEISQTLEYLCLAMTGVLTGVNQIVGGTDGGKALPALSDQYVALSKRAT
ncbi:DUF5677 domain-containing protein [Mesorhizobium atlanticum]